MKTRTLKILLIITLIITSCSDDNTPQDQLPPITQTGANTFGCLVNGRVFVPKSAPPNYTPGGNGAEGGIYVLRGTSYFSISANNYEDTYIYIYIPENTPQEITYNFQPSNGNTGRSSSNQPHCFAVIKGIFYLSYMNSGTITFSKVDDSQGVISGTFSLKLKNRDDENDIIEFTKGRFDI